MEFRKGEEEKVWFRVKRVFQISNEYYFSTREGRDIGPFASEVDALHAVQIYIDCVNNKKYSGSLAQKLAESAGWSQKEL